MKNIVVFVAILLISFTSNDAFATHTVAFAGELKSKIVNYNRATSKLATSGELGEGALEELAEKGIKTIIDLRNGLEQGQEEEKNKAEALGLTYINIPIHASLLKEEQVEKFIKAMDSAKKPILLHCISGNRAGAMLSIYHIKKGMPIEQALEIGRTAGMTASVESIVATKYRK